MATGLIHRLILLLGDLTRAQLVKQIEFLKAENLILRSKLPARITLTAPERNRLIELGKALGPAIREIITIVSPRTFARWVQKKSKETLPKKIGRRPTPVDVQALILQLARGMGIHPHPG